MRKAWAARLAQGLVALESTLPPEILVPGHRPSQEVKCFTLEGTQGTQKELKGQVSHFPLLIHIFHNHLPFSYSLITRLTLIKPTMGSRLSPRAVR